MISKEEYKKTLIRMWDTIRDDSFKGADTCHGVNCTECPMKFICSTRVENVYELIEFVEKWAKEHPIVTNGSRFLKNYPEADIYGCDDEFIYIKFPFSHGVEDCAKIPKTWWESEVDDANCD